MPLVTSSSVQGNLFRQADEPSTWINGDIWVDTDNGTVYVNVNGTATAVITGSTNITVGGVTTTLANLLVGL